MNNDRFLTRVWDKQEKVMIYEGDTKQNFSFDAIIHGINSAGLIQEIAPKLNDNFDEAEVKIIPFGDRFVPMICLGLKDKNLSSIYEYDLLKNSNNDIFMVVYRNLELDFIAVHINYFDSQLKIKPVFEMLNSFDMQVSKIIGNRWENPEILEVNL